MVLSLLAIVLGVAPAAPEAAARPNIVLIVADDLGYADVGVHGCKEFATPHIDSIARGGIRFTNGYVTGAVCAPSRAGFLTGRYQDRFGFQGNPPPGGNWGLPTAQPTIADRLKAAGYRTAAFGKWHLGEQPQFHPLRRGFDEFFGFLSGMHSYFQTDDPTWGSIVRGQERTELKQYLTFAIAEESCKFIERNAKGRFFLYAAFNAPHTPLEAPEEYLKKAAGISNPRRRTYAAMVMALDDAIGRLLAALRAARVEQDTLIFFLSDNGGPTIEGAALNGSRNDPLRGSKAQLWEGGIRVPFFMHWTGRIPAGRVIDTPIISLDILPTALAVAGATISPDAKLDGLNLWPLLDGKATELKRDPFCWKFGGAQFAVRAGDWKLVKVGADRGLYNLPQDIGETRDRSAAESQYQRTLQKTWDTWNAANPPEMLGNGPKSRKRQAEQH